METDGAQSYIPPIIIMIVILVIARYLLFPAVCRSIPLELPGYDVDFCIFFR